MDQDFEKLTPLTREIIEVVSAIPAGSVFSYGEVARLAGNPRAARQVARVLSSCSEKYGLPWHRVVNTLGQVVLKDSVAAQEQIQRLRREGVQVTDDGKVS